jgi:hypothetical protein
MIYLIPKLSDFLKINQFFQITNCLSNIQNLITVMITSLQPAFIFLWYDLLREEGTK